MPPRYGDRIELLDWIEDPIDTMIVGETYKVSRYVNGTLFVFDDEGDEQELLNGEWDLVRPPQRKKIVRNLPSWF